MQGAFTVLRAPMGHGGCGKEEHLAQIRWGRRLAKDKVLEA